jgi:hypothetical protein
MKKQRFNHVVKAILNDGEEVEFNGCGWSTPGKGKRFSRHDADMAAFDVNCAGDATAWGEKVAI